MTVEVSERSFEDAIECGLLRYGPDACAGRRDRHRARHRGLYGDMLPGGYRRRHPEDYDRALCLLPRDVVDFVLATQPKEWKKLKQHHGAAVSEQFLKRLAAEIERRGALDVLRNGIKDSGCKFQLAYFRPASGLNEETRRLHAANLFAVVRQLRYSAKNENSLDLVLFLNGIPIFTAELKNPLNGQDVEDAIRQYKTDRDPREPLLRLRPLPGAFRRRSRPGLRHDAACRAEDALPALQPGASSAAPATRPCRPRATATPPPTCGRRPGRATACSTSSASSSTRSRRRTSKGRKTGKRFLIFPRYQQLDCRAPAGRRRARARRRAALPDPALGRQRQELHHRLAGAPALHAARRRTTGASSTRSSSSPTAACSTASSRRTMRQFEQTLGVVENIDTTSRQLKEALEAGKTIIVTTLQKFPVIAQEIGELPGKRFAVIVDEAHSSQSGESTQEPQGGAARRSRWRRPRRRSAARDAEEELEEHDPRRDGRSAAGCPTSRTFAFTATPKPKTLELFGTQARRRQVRAVPPLHHAAGDRGGLHPRRARELHDLQGLLAAAEEDRGRPALRQEEGAVPAQVVRRAAPARHRREGADHGRALRRAGAERDRRQGQGDDRDALAPARRALQAGDRQVPRGARLPVQGAGGVLRHGRGRRAGRTPRPA